MYFITLNFNDLKSAFRIHWCFSAVQTNLLLFLCLLYIFVKGVQKIKINLCKLIKINEKS